MSEVPRYKAIKLKTEAGNIITYTPHGPDFVPAEAYDQLKAELSALKAGQGEAVAETTGVHCTGHVDYAPARTADAVSVPVDRLAHVESLLACPQLHTRNEYIKAAEEIRALLARQEVKL